MNSAHRWLLVGVSTIISLSLCLHSLAISIAPSLEFWAMAAPWLFPTVTVMCHKPTKLMKNVKRRHKRKHNFPTLPHMHTLTPPGYAKKEKNKQKIESRGEERSNTKKC